METNGPRSTVAVLALVLALVAMGVAVGAFVSMPKPAPDPQEAMDGLRNEIAELKTELGKSRQDLEAVAADLTARKQAPVVTVAPPAPPTPAVAGEVVQAKQVEEMVRDALLRAGVNIRMMPGELPQPVKDAMAKVAPGVEIARCEQRQTYFRIYGRLKGEDYDYRIKPDGGILEADLPLEVVPKEITDAATKAVAGLQIVDATQRLEDGAVIFDLGGRAEQKRYEMRLSATGQVLNTEVHGGRNQGGGWRPQGGGGGGRTQEGGAQKPPAPPVQENF